MSLVLADDADALAAPAASADASPVVRELGRTDYEVAWHAMQAFTLARTSESADEIWITEHPPIYTLGLAGRRQHLRRANGIPVLQVDRGGQVTYHGPGQAIVYLLFDLRRRRLAVRSMVRAIEGAVIEFLANLDIAAYGKDSAPGVYVRRSGLEAKIAALGLRVKNGCTFHGVSINVDMDLAPFADIDPCGYPGLPVTQIRDFGPAPGVEQAGRSLAPLLARSISNA